MKVKTHYYWNEQRIEKELNVEGDDGELYALGGSILSMALEKIDLATLCMAKGKDRVRQLKSSIYKVTEYPGAEFNYFFRNPQGTLQIERHEHSVLVTCGPHFSVECFDNGEWHFVVDALDGVYKADLWHRAYGYPLWYGREKPSYLTQHSITYGYNWSGDVDGEFTYKGKLLRLRVLVSVKDMLLWIPLLLSLVAGKIGDMLHLTRCIPLCTTCGWA